MWKRDKVGDDEFVLYDKDGESVPPLTSNSNMF